MQNDRPLSFADRLVARIEATRSHAVVGLDPVYNRLPAVLRPHPSADPRQVADAIIGFNRGVIDAVHDLVPAVKPQIAFYERHGLEGLRAYAETVAYARRMGLLVIADVKRNDIGSTAAAYADAHLGRAGVADDDPGDLLPTELVADAATLNPYLGSDGIDPFLERTAAGKGLFVLVKTSNPSSGQLQDLPVEYEGRRRPLYEVVALLVQEWGQRAGGGTHGYCPVGAVVGATYPAHARRLRELMPSSFFLVPGYGTQGGTAADVVHCFNDDGLGALISASRSVLYAFSGDGAQFGAAARAAVTQMNADINQELRRRSLLHWSTGRSS